jgi:DNA-binding IclR family transcriptional regulator
MARPAPGADRSVAVLELLADNPDERFTLSEVARRCGLNKATAHALLSALTTHGILLRHPDEKRYSLGPRLVAIGDAALRGYTAIDFAPSVLGRLAADTGLSATAMRLEDDVISVIARAGGGTGTGGGPVAVDVAPNLPHIPPLGALFMAWTDEPSIEAWLARAPASEVVGKVLEALPAVRRHGFVTTLASPEWVRLMAAMNDGLPHDRMRVLLADLGRRGALATDIDERRRYQVAGVSAPVFRGDGHVELSVSAAAPVDRPDGLELTGAQLLDLGARVVVAAEELTLAVHGHGPEGNHVA